LYTPYKQDFIGVRENSLIINETVFLYVILIKQNASYVVGEGSLLDSSVALLPQNDILRVFRQPLDIH